MKKISRVKMGLCSMIAVASFATLPASAADSYNGSDSAANWAGPYAGVHFGMTWGDFKNDSGVPGPNGSSDSLMGGGQAGYNWQFNHIVLGVEGDFSKLDVGTHSGAVTFDEDWDATLRGRAGYAIGRMLPYATFGLGLTDAEAKLTGAGSDSNVEPGIAAGAGLDGMISDRWSARAEYLFVDVPKDTYHTGGTAVSGGSSNNTIRVGLNYKF